MVNHYYSREPEAQSDPIYWTANLKGNGFRFKTDQGVFSKKEVDFGSRLLIESYILPEAQGPILDVGCGYGPIGLSLAKSFPERAVHMVDVNLRAAGLAKENAALNDIPNAVIYESDRYEAVEEKGFASIVTNPPIRAGKRIVHDILEQSRDYLVPGGTLWVVIQKKQGAPSAKAKMEEVFGEVETAAKSKGYYIFKAIKH